MSIHEKIDEFLFQNLISDMRKIEDNGIYRENELRYNFSQINEIEKIRLLNDFMELLSDIYLISQSPIKMMNDMDRLNFSLDKINL